MKHSETEKNHPIARHRDGAIEVAVFRNETEKGAVYNTERTRSYQDKDGNWQKTHSFPERDLLKAAKLDEKAYESIQHSRKQSRREYVERQQSEQQRTNPREHPREQ